MSDLTTSRLRLEPMSAKHIDGLQATNGDALVMQYLGGQAETMDNTRAMVARVAARWREWGFGWWSIFEKDSDELIGAGGIQYLNKIPGQPLELGWRFRRDRWGKGYAGEVAQVLADYAFTRLKAPLVCATCHPDNLASQKVMTRLGMRQFDLRLADGVPALYYELTQAEWRARR